MIVFFTARLLESLLQNNQGIQKLHVFFRFVCEGRHQIQFDPAFDLNNATFAEASRFYKDELSISARTAATLLSQTSEVMVDLVEESNWDNDWERDLHLGNLSSRLIAVLSVDDAISLLEQPIGVLVENSKNDFHFFRGIMSRTEKEKVDDYLRSGWLTTLHGGGSTIKDQMRSRSESKPQSLRTFVLIDSDRMHPDELDVNWKPSDYESCSGFEYEEQAKKLFPQRYWRLERRSIESYLPINELIRLASPERVTAFKALTCEQRWYFNMKTGFNGDKNNLRAKDLYDNLSETDKNHLAKGFGKKSADHFRVTKEREFEWDDEALRESREPLTRFFCLF